MERRDHPAAQLGQRGHHHAVGTGHRVEPQRRFGDAELGPTTSRTSRRAAARGITPRSSSKAGDSAQASSHAFVRLRARRLHASIAARAIKGSGEDGGAAGAEPAAFFRPASRRWPMMGIMASNDDKLGGGAGM